MWSNVLENIDVKITYFCLIDNFFFSVLFCLFFMMMSQLNRRFFVLWKKRKKSGIKKKSMCNTGKPVITHFNCNTRPDESCIYIYVRYYNFLPCVRSTAVFFSFSPFICLSEHERNNHNNWGCRRRRLLLIHLYMYKKNWEGSYVTTVRYIRCECLTICPIERKKKKK